MLADIGNAVFKTAGSGEDSRVLLIYVFAAEPESPAYSNTGGKRWHLVALHGTQRIRTGISKRAAPIWFTARFRVRVPVPEPKFRAQVRLTGHKTPSVP